MPQHMQENQPALDTPLLTTFSNFNLQRMSHCILFLPPHGFGFDYKIMVEMAFKKQSVNLTIIGDGYRALGEKDLQRLFELVRDTEVPSYLYIAAHGNLFADTKKHYFSIGSQEKPMYQATEDFLNRLYAASNYKRIDVQFVSCFAGAGFREMPPPSLPPHSMIFALQENEHYIMDDVCFFSYLSSNNICDGDLSASNMLLSYATKTDRMNMLRPSLFTTSISREAVSKTNTAHCDLYKKAMGSTSAFFSEEKKQQALRHLKPFYTPEKILQLIQHYESTSHRVAERMAFQLAADLSAPNPRTLLFQIFSRHTQALHQDVNLDLNDVMKSRDFKILSTSNMSFGIKATESLRQTVLPASQSQPLATPIPIMRSASMPADISNINAPTKRIAGAPLYFATSAAESAGKMNQPTHGGVLKAIGNSPKPRLVCTPLHSPVVGSLVYSLTANAFFGDGNGEMLPFHVMVDAAKLPLFRCFPATFLTLSAGSLLVSKFAPDMIRQGEAWQKKFYSTEKLLARDEQLKEQGRSPIQRYHMMVASHEAAMGLAFLKLMHAVSDANIKLPQKIHDNISPKVFQTITENIRPLPEIWHGWKLLQDPDTYARIKKAIVQWMNRSKSDHSSTSMPANSNTTTENQSTETPRFSFMNGLKNLIFSEASASEVDFRKRLEYLIDESTELCTKPVLSGVDVKTQQRHNRFVDSILPCHQGASPPLADEQLKAAILDAQQAILELSEYAYHPMRWQETFARRGALLYDSRNLKEEVTSLFNGLNKLSSQMLPQYMNLSPPEFNEPPHGGMITGDMIKNDPSCFTSGRKLFLITSDNELRICARWDAGSVNFHGDLADNRPVIAAGELSCYDDIASYSLLSGHFRPFASPSVLRHVEETMLKYLPYSSRECLKYEYCGWVINNDLYRRDFKDILHSSMKSKVSPALGELISDSNPYANVILPWLTHKPYSVPHYPYLEAIKLQKAPKQSLLNSALESEWSVPARPSFLSSFLGSLFWGQASACEIDPTARWGYSFDLSWPAVEKNDGNCSAPASMPMFRSLSAESRNPATSPDPADKPRDVSNERAVTNEVELTPDKFISAPAQTTLPDSEKETGYIYKGIGLRAPRPTAAEPFISSPTLFFQLNGEGVFVGGQCSVGKMDCQVGVGTDEETFRNLYKRFISGEQETLGYITDPHGRYYEYCITPLPWTTKQVSVTVTEMKEDGGRYADVKSHSKTTQVKLKKVTISHHKNKGQLEAAYAELIRELRQDRLDCALQALSKSLDIALAPDTFNPQAAKNLFFDTVAPYGDIEQCDKRDALQQRISNAVEQDVTTLISQLNEALALDTYNPKEADRLVRAAGNRYAGFDFFDAGEVGLKAQLQQRILNAVERDVTTLIGQLNEVLALDTYNLQEADRLVSAAGDRYAGFDFFDANEAGLKAQLQQWMLYGKETNDVVKAVDTKNHFAAEVSAAINDYNSADPIQQQIVADSLRLFKSDAQGLLRTEIEHIRGVEQQLHEQTEAIAAYLDTERTVEHSPTHSGLETLKEVAVELEKMGAAAATHSTQLQAIRWAKEYQLQLQPLREERFNIQVTALVADVVGYVLKASCNDKDTAHHLNHLETAITSFLDIGLKGVSQRLEAATTGVGHHDVNDDISFMLSMRAIITSVFSSLTHHRENTVPAYLMPISQVISAVDGVVTPIATTWQTASIEALLDIPHIKAGLLLAESTHGVDRVRYVMSYFLQHLKAYKQNPALLAAGWMNYAKRHADVISVWLERGTGYQLSQYVPAMPYYLSNWSVLPLAVLSMTDKLYFKSRESRGEAPETFLPMMAETICHVASHPVEICGALFASQVIDAGLMIYGLPPITTYIVLPALTGFVLGQAMDERTITAPLQNGLFYFDSGIKSGDLEALLKAEAKLVQVREAEAKLLKSNPKTQLLSQGLRDVAVGIHDNIEPLLAAASAHARQLLTFANDLHDNLAEMTTCYSVSGVQAMRHALETKHAIHGPQRDKVLRDLQQVVGSVDPMLQLPNQLNEMKRQLIELTREVELSKRCLQLSPERISMLEKHLGVIQHCMVELEQRLKSTDIEAFLSTLDALVKTDDFERLKPTEEQLSEGFRFVKHHAIAECSANALIAGLTYLFDEAKAVRVRKDLPLPNWPLPTTASHQGMFFASKREPVVPQRQSAKMVNPFHKQVAKASMDCFQSGPSLNACALFVKPSKPAALLTQPGACYATK